MTRRAGEATKLATLEAVRELTEGEPVELWLTREGRVVLRSWNECGNAYTNIDLFALAEGGIESAVAAL